jgi:folate-dependent phosphoribosylglycinamide formyltransferase PurN
VSDNDSGLAVVVLSCGQLGCEVAERLRITPGVRAVTLITAPYRQRRLSMLGKLRHVYRMQGGLGLARVVADKLTRPLRGRRDDDATDVSTTVLHPSIPHQHFADFHDPACILALRQLEPDLGVIAGTYVLQESVFGVPRLGSINLHSGKAPEYRGAAPAFWEMYNGETCVGITIHKVATALDAGDVLLQELFPLDPAPAGGAMPYVERYRTEVLRPNGVRMLAEAVAQIARGTLVGTPQQQAGARTYRSPDHRAIRELQRRVDARRRRGRHEASDQARTRAGGLPERMVSATPPGQGDRRPLPPGG